MNIPKLPINIVQKGVYRYILYKILLTVCACVVVGVRGGGGGGRSEFCNFQTSLSIRLLFLVNVLLHSLIAMCLEPKNDMAFIALDKRLYIYKKKKHMVWVFMGSVTVMLSTLAGSPKAGTTTAMPVNRWDKIVALRPRYPTFLLDRAADDWCIMSILQVVKKNNNKYLFNPFSSRDN